VNAARRVAQKGPGGQFGASEALTQGIYRGAQRDVRAQAKRAGISAYNDRIAMTKRRYAGAGIAGAGYFASMGVSNNRSRTAANQNTFATRRMRRENIGVSSGALQTFDAYSRAIGGK
jgi:hypothetical protein